MYIEEVKAVTIEEEVEEEERVSSGNEETLSSDTRGTLVVDVRKVVVGIGARALFYPTLLYNVVRNRIQTEFRWWDWIDEFVLLGAVPFPSDVKRLKKLGVCGVVTLNEPYETLVPTSLYRAQGIHNLVLPTRDYMFAPSLTDIFQAVEFIHGKLLDAFDFSRSLVIHREIQNLLDGGNKYPLFNYIFFVSQENASSGQRTYVHCKAGRGRSTTIVLCYLVRYKQMTPNDAYEYVKAIRPRVLLASSQWKAVQEFYSHLMMKTGITHPLTFPISRSPGFIAAKNLLAFDDSSALIITEADLDGYDPGNLEPGEARNERRSDFGLIWRVRIAGVAALSRVSCLWLNCQPPIVQLAPADTVDIHDTHKP